jgi:hypothetical protein
MGQIVTCLLAYFEASWALHSECRGIDEDTDFEGDHRPPAAVIDLAQHPKFIVDG